MNSPAPKLFEIGAQALGVLTRESPAVGGRELTEGYLTQPAIMVQLEPWGELLSLKGTLNLEGATLKRGELNAGIVGEGYIDRRHPHTYLHELVLTSAKRFGMDRTSGVSISVGKGFAPFGTDDPMARPFEKYPINHHLAQILERAIAIGAVRAGPWILEGGAFNGDEPTGPGDTPNRNRYWDSWSGRVTFLPWRQAELQTSYARVKSPENPDGVARINASRAHRFASKIRNTPATPFRMGAHGGPCRIGAFLHIHVASGRNVRQLRSIERRSPSREHGAAG